MIKENQKLLNRIQIVLDAVVIIAAYVLSWYIRFRSGLFELGSMVFVFAGIYEGSVVSGTCISGSVLCIPIVYTEAGAGKKAGSMACGSGECDRSDGCDHGIFPGQAFDRSRWVVFIFCFVNITMEV